MSDNKPLIIEFSKEHIFQLNELKVPVDAKENWYMIYFDGSRCKKGRGVGIISNISQVVTIPYSFKISFPCTNNNVEYEALILAIKTTIKLKLRRVKFIGDSFLVMNQVKGFFQCREPYYKNTKK